jgi:CHAT domain-containing protein
LATPEDEARQVGLRLGVKALTGPAATLANVQQALPAARLAHFATHGVLDVENPYESYLLLSAGERLTAWQLFQGASQADLLILSACNTRRGPVRPLAQFTSDESSIAGLALRAGALRILSSLWGANDEQSRELMDLFYAELAGRPEEPAVALQRAKIAIAERGVQPYSFANFVLTVRDLDSVRLPVQ